MFRKLLALTILFALLPGLSLATKVSLLVHESDTYAVQKALSGLKLPEDIKVNTFHSIENIKNDSGKLEYISDSEIILLDVMGSKYSEFLLENLDPGSKQVYALNSGRDNQKLRKQGILFDTDVRSYFRYKSVQNLQNMIRRALHKSLQREISFKEPVKRPDTGIYHPDSKKVFTEYSDYLQWYKDSGKYKQDRPWIGVLLYSSCLTPGKRAAYEYCLQSLERAGFNLLACYGYRNTEQVMDSYLSDEKEEARIGALLSFSLKFQSAGNPRVKKALSELNVPVINAIKLFFNTAREWQEDPRGIVPSGVVTNIANPEVSGLIEPTVLMGKKRVREPELGDVYKTVPIKDNWQHLLQRLKKWVQ